MQDKQSPETLAQEHTIEAIRARLDRETHHSYLGDFVMGGVDGTVTTFAVISSVTGAGLSSKIALIMALANLLADGFSMGSSAFLKARTDQNLLKKAKKMEEVHLDLIPEGEKDEMREIFRRKGFEGPILEDIIKALLKNREHWINLMLTEELGVRVASPSPFKVGIITFISFFCVGAIPLLPFLFFTNQGSLELFKVSAFLTGLVFFGVGSLKGKLDGQPPLLSGLETLILGGLAASLAFAVGLTIKETA